MGVPAFTNSSGLGPLPRLLKEVGGERMMARVFQSEGLPVSAAFGPGFWMPLRVLLNIFEQSAIATGDPLLGLHVGQAMRPEDFGLFVKYATSAPELRTAIARVNENIVYHQTGTRFGLDANESIARWHYRVVDPGPSGQRHHAEHVLWPMMTLMRSYLGPRWVPIRIECSYDKPKCWRQVERAFGAAIAYGKSANAIIFEERLLGTRSARSIPIEDQITRRDLKRMAAHRPPATIVDSVREIARVRLVEPLTDIEGTAHLLGMSTRNLQLLLGDENLTFREVLEQVRMTRALELLCETDIPIKTIAFALGYTDPTSFTRAFRRLTGRSPLHSRGKHKRENGSDNSI